MAEFVSSSLVLSLVLLGFVSMDHFNYSDLRYFRFQSESTGACLEQGPGDEGLVVASICNSHPSQVWATADMQFFRNAESNQCLETSPDGKTIFTRPCDFTKETKKWSVTNEHIKSLATGLCLDQNVKAVPCRYDEGQMWRHNF